MVLVIFGDNIEAAFGKAQYLLLYLSAGVVAALAQLPALAGANVPMLGASGAVAGVLGAYLRLFPHHRVDALWPDLLFFFGLSRVTVSAGTMLFVWFLTQLLSGTAAITTAASGGVAWWAHIGGFVFGYLVAGRYRRLRYRSYAA